MFDCAIHYWVEFLDLSRITPSVLLFVAPRDNLQENVQEYVEADKGESFEGRTYQYSGFGR